MCLISVFITLVSSEDLASSDTRAASARGGLDVDIYFYLDMICLACVLNYMHQLYGMEFQFYSRSDSGVVAVQ